jgi:hypothetical protein
LLQVYAMASAQCSSRSFSYVLITSPAALERSLLTRTSAGQRLSTETVVLQAQQQPESEHEHDV